MRFRRPRQKGKAKAKAQLPVQPKVADVWDVVVEKVHHMSTFTCDNMELKGLTAYSPEMLNVPSVVNCGRDWINDFPGVNAVMNGLSVKFKADRSRGLAGRSQQKQGPAKGCMKS